MRKRDGEGLQGATFGVMEATVMLLGVMTGLSATGNRFILVIGLLMAGLADAVANGVGFHVSEETRKGHTQREVWKTMLFAFLGTSLTVAIMILPVLLLPVKQAVITAWIIGVIILCSLGYAVGRIAKRTSPYKLMLEYLAFGVLASMLCYGLGVLVIYLSSHI